MKQHSRMLSHRFLSHPAVDQLLIHWQLWASLTLSICGFWMGTVDTLLIIFPEGCALLILHSDFSIHTDTSHVLQCIPSQICGECHPLHLFYHLYFLTLILKPTNFSSSHSFMDRFRRNPCSFSCCYLPPQFLIPSPAQKTSLCWSRLVYAG